MKKNNIIAVLLFAILVTPLFFISNKENVIKNLTFKQIEDRTAPFNYKKEYTFTIKELKNKNNTLEFNIINHLVEIYINNKLIFELKEEKTNENILIKIPLNKEYINKKVKIVLTPINENIKNDLDLEIK